MPLYKTPQSFPGVNQLPKPVGSLIDMLFPKDTLPMPGAVIGPRVPVPKAASKSLLEAFRPWGKSLEKAYPDMYGPSQVPGVPAALGRFDEANQLLKALLDRQRHPL